VSGAPSAPPVSIEDQVRWAEGALARTKNYHAKLARYGRTHPASAAIEIQRAEAVVATLKRLAYGEQP